MRTSLISKIILAVVGLLLALCFFASCKNLQYNGVNNDTNISSRNKKILLGVCDRNFPQDPPKYIRGKDSLIINTEIDTVYDIDTLLHDTTIYITNTNKYYYNRVDTVLQPENPYKLTACNDERRVLEKELDKLNNENEFLKDQIRKMRFKQWMGWIVSASIIALWILRIYLKVKSKIT